MVWIVCYMGESLEFNSLKFVQMHNLFVQFAKLLDKTDKSTIPTNKHMGTMH